MGSEYTCRRAASGPEKSFIVTLRGLQCNPTGTAYVRAVRDVCFVLPD